MIILFYHKLIAAGGAERLLVRQYQHLKARGIPVQIWTLELHADALFGLHKMEVRVINNWVQVYNEYRKYSSAYFIIDSGIMQWSLIYALSFGRVKFSINYHHPMWMSFNDTHKWSFRHSRKTEKYLAGKEYDSEMIREPGILKKFVYTIKELVFFQFLKGAQNVWVLSEFSRAEKMTYFNYEAKVRRGALDEAVRVKILPIENSLNLLCVGRLDKNKRIDLLIESVSQLNINLEFTLTIIGSGPESEKLKDLAVKLGVADKVNFLGFVNESTLSEEYKKADVFITLDMADFKITMFEGLSKGCRVLVTKETEVPEDLASFVYKCDYNTESVNESIVRMITQNSVESVDLSAYTWEKYFDLKLNDIIAGDNKILVKRFNIVWGKALKWEFYQNIQQRHNLPNSISNLNELEKWPAITKDDLQNIKFSKYQLLHKVSTGGSTGTILSLPTGIRQKKHEYRISQYYRRQIFPSYAIILVWGHSHLMGSGLNKIKNLVLRRVKDKIRKYYRISTYSATEGIGNRIHNYSQIISGPKILLGYAKTIYEILKKQPDLLRRNDLEVLLTAESLSKQQRLTWDEKSIVVNYEYGMAETNVIAYKIRERFANKYVVVREHILGACGKNNELLVTCLYGRRFPLIKYSTGDHLDLDELDRSNLLDFGSLLTFNDVQGRSNDFILIKYNDKSTRVHSEYFTHVLKTIAGIHKFIVLQKSCDTIEVFVDCENNVDLAAISNTILDKIPMENKVIVKRKALQNNKAGKANYNSI